MTTTTRRTLDASTPTRRRHPLTPVELASAGILGGLAVTVRLATIIAPVGPVFNAFACVPIAVLAYQRRPRAIMAAAVAMILATMVLGGVTTLLISCAVVIIGWAIGTLHRRGAGPWSLAGLIAGFAAAAFVGVDALMLVFAESRDLSLRSAKASGLGVARALEAIPGMAGQAREFRSMLDWFVEHWWVWIGGGAALGAAIITLVGHLAFRLVLRRLHLDRGEDRLYDGLAQHRDRAVGPLPVRLSGVGFVHRGSSQAALQDIDFTVEPGEFVVVVGPNGSGKSTLAAVLAGATPDHGQVHRPGSPGLGAVGGTALVAQRTELQILGDTVADDLTWGCPPDLPVDVEALLHQVGLDGLAGEPTSSLSGGQLQRLTIAGALARRPALLISDESTSMIDPAGRTEVMGLLSRLPREQGMAVVHITHDPDEAALADRVVRIEAGRIAPAAVPGQADPAAAQRDSQPVQTSPYEREAPHRRQAPLLRLAGVTHTYGLDGPWEHTALREVNLSVHAGDFVVITGHNGSGKSTLARIMTGLLAPTWGDATLAGRPMTMQVGKVGLGMQFARLQVLRPTVALDVLDCARVAVQHDQPGPIDLAFVAGAIAEVGLGPELANRDIDTLSGGQLRRVALAGMLIRQPPVLVLDEPFAGLDLDSRTRLLSILAGRQARGTAIVVISHDMHGLHEAATRHYDLTGGVLR